MCSPVDYALLYEENGHEEAWELAKLIAELSHILRVQMFGEYETKKILQRYGYDEAKKIIDDYKLSYTE